MSNIHQPERQPGETFEQYKARRAASKAATRAITAHGLGNQRKLPSSREQLRDAKRRNGNGPKGTYSLGLVQWQRKRDQQRVAEHYLHDEHGAFTLTGAKANGIGGPPRLGRMEGHLAPRDPVPMGRRKWLAGISAQRGF